MLHSYRKRKRLQGPVLIYGIAGIGVLAGLILIVMWLLEPNRPLNLMFATDTATATITASPTVTSTPTLTPTETATPTMTTTATPAAPFSYTIQEGESLQVISEKFGLGDDGIPLILLLNPYTAEGASNSIDPVTQYIYPGQSIIIPNPGMQLPTATPIPADLPRGTKIEYTVQAGDSLGGIATRFNSTVEEIMKLNELEDANAIFVGQILIIPVNLVTPTATRPPTSTPVTPGAISTLVPTTAP
jgi:LysM repeat protein